MDYKRTSRPTQPFGIDQQTIAVVVELTRSLHSFDADDGARCEFYDHRDLCRAIVTGLAGGHPDGVTVRCNGEQVAWRGGDLEIALQILVAARYEINGPWSKEQIDALDAVIKALDRLHDASKVSPQSRH